MKRLLLALCLCSSCAGCPVQPTPSSDATPPPVVHYSCITVCEHAAGLGCRWADNTPDQAPCTEVCANAMAFGIGWDLACRTQAQTCVDVNKCQ